MVTTLLLVFKDGAGRSVLLTVRNPVTTLKEVKIYEVKDKISDSRSLPGTDGKQVMEAFIDLM